MLLLLSPPALATAPSAPGDITITEFQADTSEVPQYYGEWFEVRNNSGTTLSLEGATFTSSSGAFTVDVAFLLDPEAYAVLGASGERSDASALDFNGGVPVDLVYNFFESVDLAQSGDTLVATYGSVVLDSLVWDASWTPVRERAHAASLNALDLEWANDLAFNWCPSAARIGRSDLYGSPGVANDYCATDPGNDTDGDGYTETGGDCDDTHPDVNPSAVDGIAAPHGSANDDADCDGVRDDGITDDDGDGYAEVDGDCDDTDGSVHPGEPEVANGIDDDCDGEIDNLDMDGDGYGTDRDCDDADPDVHPGASEIPYDGVDQDCSRGDAVDVDRDQAIAVEAGGEDCDDGNDGIHPGAEERCDGVDEDCDGTVDEDAVDAVDWYADADGDGHGDADERISACDAPDGYVAEATDCDDADATRYPGSVERCDGADNDCDETTKDPAACDKKSAVDEGACGCATTPASWPLLGLPLVIVRRARRADRRQRASTAASSTAAPPEPARGSPPEGSPGSSSRR